MVAAGVAFMARNVAGKGRGRQEWDAGQRELKELDQLRVLNRPWRAKSFGFQVLG